MLGEGAAFVFCGGAKCETDPHKVSHKVRVSKAAKHAK
jgi:hypothetical protein